MIGICLSSVSAVPAGAPAWNPSSPPLNSVRRVFPVPLRARDYSEKRFQGTVPATPLNEYPTLSRSVRLSDLRGRDLDRLGRGDDPSLAGGGCRRRVLRSRLDGPPLAPGRGYPLRKYSLGGSCRTTRLGARLLAPAPKPPAPHIHDHLRDRRSVALRDGTCASRARPGFSRGRGPGHAVLEDQVQIAVTAFRLRPEVDVVTQPAANPAERKASSKTHL